MQFTICLAVRSLAGVPTSKFNFQPIPALERHGVDVARDDILQNLVAKDDQLLNGKLPWQGAEEKSTLLMQMLIQASSLPGDVVHDCTAAIGEYLRLQTQISAFLCMFTFIVLWTFLPYF